MKKIDFIKNRKVFFIIAAVVLVIGIASFIIRGFNLDTDFIGGTTMQVEMGKIITEDDEAQIKSVIESTSGVSVTSFQRANNGTQFIAKMKEIDSETRVITGDALKEKFGLEDNDLLNVTSVGASISKDIRNSAIVSTVAAIFLMMIYISFRFDFASGLAAVTCLAHDIFVMLATYSILQIPLSSTMIAALLTILGYSINATIIIFDRIRENIKKNQKNSFEDNTNIGTNQTITRSLYTSLTTLFTIGALYFLGVNSVKQFALPIISGIIAGFFSSVCLSGNFWALYRKLFSKKKKA